MEKRRVYLARAEVTSRLRSGGLILTLEVEAVADKSCLSQSTNTLSLIWEKTPLALQRKLTAKFNFSSLAFRSISDIPLSRSYCPKEETEECARLDKANA